MKLQLKTIDTGAEGNTLGHMKYGGKFSCFTVELPWLDNKPFISCIPAGLYECEKHLSPKFGHCILVKNVAGRENILIHIGNYKRNTKGCILPGRSFVDMDNDGLIDVTSSGDTMAKLRSVLPEKFQLEIRRTI
tara:strand:+ start:344 stop:745 length:402 start_codon:yes stop_codon:yes gene_type:complete